MKNRISYLDGHRGVAILLVVFFHAFTRWPELVPYGDAYAHVFLFEYGRYGVQLFFLVSGFVILMTLEKCQGTRTFMYRRWLRLFPAMLICSVIIFATAPLFSARPSGAPSLTGLLPGLTFIDPIWWGKLLGHPVTALEDSFWSLYVEFKFYLFVSVIYYWRGRNAMFGALLIAYALAVAVNLANASYGTHMTHLMATAIHHLSFAHFGWFAAGAAFYVYHKHQDKAWFAFGVLITLVSAFVTADRHWQPFWFIASIGLLFAASIVMPVVQTALSNKWLQIFGFISYPLYLLHENMMLSAINQLGHALPFVPGPLLHLIALFAISLVAHQIARHLEPALSQRISRVFA